jgi:hypothetical protein
VIIVACVGLAVLALAGGTALILHSATLNRRPARLPARLLASLDSASDRMQKTDLIEQLKTAPAIVLLGGSRALRFDPAYLKQRTGLTGFNAAVTGARPEDAWALVNLLHARFPAARFRFIWVIHADEFAPKSLDPGLVYDATLARYFPASLITPLTRAEAAHLRIDAMQRGRVFAPDGMVRRDGFDRLFPRPGNDARGVNNNIRQALKLYATTAARLSPRSTFYFAKTLALMQAIAARPPIIVSAPVDERILAATAHRGWAVRQQLVLRLLRRLQGRYRFAFADFSQAAACGCTANDFYDGIHLRLSGTDKVMAALLRRFPNELDPSFGHHNVSRFRPAPTPLPVATLAQQISTLLPEPSRRAGKSRDRTILLSWPMHRQLELFV